MANARLLLEIAASLGTFREDLGRAVAIAESNAKRIDKAFSGVKGAISNTLKGLVSGFVAALSVRAFVGMIKGSIDAADKLHDLSQTTGVAVETLGGIGFAAKQAGSDLDGVAKAFGKFNLQIAKAIEGEADAAKAFNLLGISVKDLNNTKPDEILARVADKFSSYADGPKKAALANEFFKKGYQELILLLNDGGDVLRANIAYFQKYSGLNEELTKKADAFNNSVEKMKLLNGAFGNALAANLLPSLQSLVNLYVEGKEKGDGFAGTADRIAEGLKVFAKGAAIAAFSLINIGDALAALVARGVAISEGRFKDAFVNIVVEEERQLKSLQAQYNKLMDAIEGKNATPGLSGPKQKLPPAPGLGSKDADDSRKRMLDQQLKAFENSIKDEQDILKDREHFLQAYYQDDQIGIHEYFATRQEIISASLAKEIEAFDGEIAALKAFAASASPKDRIDTETKIADVVAKRSKSEQDAAVKGIDLWFQQKKAAKEFRDQIEDISITLAQLSGDSIASGLAAFDKANEKFRAQAITRAVSPDLATSAEGDLALRKSDALRDLTAKQLVLNDTQRKYGNIIDEIGIKQSRIDLLRASGNITELDAINQKSALATSYIAVLEKEAAAYEVVAAALPSGTARDEALQHVQRLRLEIDQLAASANVLENAFRGIGVDSLTDGLADVVTGTKSVSAAAKDMEKQVIASIGRMASKNISEALFGTKGPLGDAPGLLAKLFGGGAKAAAGTAGGTATGVAVGVAGAASADAGLASVGGSATIAATALSAELAPSVAMASLALSAELSTSVSAASLALSTGLVSAATAAATALSLVGASSAASSGGSLVGAFAGLAQGGGLARGTDSARGGLTLVGERGPEIVNMPRGAQVIPNDLLGKFASLFPRGFSGKLEHFASGGISRGGMALVGERGKEAVYLPRGAQVIPNDVLMSRRSSKQTIVNNYATVNVLPGASTKTANQAAAQNALAVQRATRNL